jgi:hypothetical protein
LVEAHPTENINGCIDKVMEGPVSLGTPRCNDKAAGNELVHTVVARRVEGAQLCERPTRIGDHNAFPGSRTAQRTGQGKAQFTGA